MIFVTRRTRRRHGEHEDYCIFIWNLGISNPPFHSCSKKRIMRNLFIVLTILTLCSCGPQRKDESVQNSKQAILKSEQDFAEMVATQGVAEAFAFYADDSAVIQRRDGLIRGKEAIRKHYMDWPYTQVVLKWKPDFVYVSASGDLGYTYGNYFFTGIDSTGQVIKDAGVFHTVWKRQKDGTWKYVWD